MLKSYKKFINENNEDSEVIQELLDDLPYTNEELDQFMEGKKTGVALKVLAVGLTNRLVQQTRRVISAKTTDEKLDHLAKAISIAGGISAISVVVSGGSKSGLSKIIGLSALKN